MKKIVILILLMLSIGGATALEIKSYSASLEVKGGHAAQDITLNIVNRQETKVGEFRYPFFGNVRDVVVYGNGERIPFEKDASGGKVYIKANLSKKLDTNDAYTLRYLYNISGIVERRDDLYILTTTYPLFANVKNFNLSITLPPGYGLAENKVSMSPEGRVTSDGRRMILNWELHEPIPSEFGNFRVIVLYESLAPYEQPPGGYTYVIVGVGVLILLALIIVLKREKMRKYFEKKDKRYEEKIDILRGDEQKIMKLVIENNGIDQREIVRKTGFSKTKVSKILAELEKRDAVKKEQVGRKNKIFLKE